jgi:hypothetical protein
VDVRRVVRTSGPLHNIVRGTGEVARAVIRLSRRRAETIYLGRELGVEPRRGLGQSGQRNPMMLVSRITQLLTGSNVDRRNHSINAVSALRGVEFIRHCEEIRVVDRLHSCPWDHSGSFQIVSMSMTIGGRLGGCVRPGSLGGTAGFAILFPCRPCFTGVASLVR